MVPGLLAPTSVGGVFVWCATLCPIFTCGLGWREVRNYVVAGKVEVVEPALMAEHPLALLVDWPGGDTAHWKGILIRTAVQASVLSVVLGFGTVLLGLILCRAGGTSLHDAWQGDTCKLDMEPSLVVLAVGTGLIQVFASYVSFHGARNRDGFASAVIAEGEANKRAELTLEDWPRSYSSIIKSGAQSSEASISDQSSKHVHGMMHGDTHHMIPL
eukprot:TRINITY_DN5958_c0_g1_i2.p1 TRINITY_DN5958_c0_g1~~TRINITY_DN5958_c0_g1_i2.p1  ORF type:complete len:215 (+),score=27.21 TRINITY_DN5958_c0_g1_i2:297-941(+)